ncbi:unnamed protein product [Clavelina lepadiformis]|uniref:Uncharacterized protein n=1 Tax=Clavelina lepadiformis TaxID=159417 RepID=A0ABP0GMQ5_CLALP
MEDGELEETISELEPGQRGPKRNQSVLDDDEEETLSIKPPPVSNKKHKRHHKKHKLKEEKKKKKHRDHHNRNIKVDFAYYQGSGALLVIFPTSLFDQLQFSSLGKQD